MERGIWIAWVYGSSPSACPDARSSSTGWPHRVGPGHRRSDRISHAGSECEVLTSANGTRKALDQLQRGNHRLRAGHDQL